jgi:hypothetical protein
LLYSDQNKSVYNMIWLVLTTNKSSVFKLHVEYEYFVLEKIVKIETYLKTNRDKWSKRND